MTARGWGNKLGDNPTMGSDYDTLPRLDSPDVPAEVVLQFAYASLHVRIIATCGHIASGREVWRNEIFSFILVSHYKPRPVVKHIEARNDFPHADPVDEFTVFNIGGNKYRLVTAINYQYQMVYIRHILTHAEYSRGKWKLSKMQPWKPAAIESLADTMPGMIRDEPEYERLLEIARTLMEKPESSLTPAEGRLLQLLGLVIEEYEDRVHPLPKTKPDKMLAFLLEEKGFGGRLILLRSFPRPGIGNSRRQTRYQQGTGQQTADFFHVPVELLL